LAHLPPLLQFSELIIAQNFAHRALRTHAEGGQVQVVLGATSVCPTALT